MKNIQKSVLALLSITLLFLFGCSSQMKTVTYAPDGITKVSETEQPGSMFGPSSYDIGFAGMYRDFSESKTRRTSAIMKAESPVDPVAKAYSDALKIVAIAFISNERFDVKAPTTGFDVLYKGVDALVPIAGMAGIWQTAVAGFNEVGARFGDGANVTNSFNRTEANSAAAGYGTSSPMASGTMPASEVVKVDPLVVTIPAVQ